METLSKGEAFMEYSFIIRLLYSYNVTLWIGFICLGIWTSYYREDDNEVSGYIKGGKFLDQLIKYQLLEKDCIPWVWLKCRIFWVQGFCNQEAMHCNINFQPPCQGKYCTVTVMSKCSQRPSLPICIKKNPMSYHISHTLCTLQTRYANLLCLACSCHKLR